jgi:hypothetical protein
MHSNKLSKQFSFSELLLFLTAVTLFVVAGFIHQTTLKPKLSLTKQKTAINISNKILLYFSVGNKRLLSDLIWIQTLLESDDEHYSQKDLNSWMYLRFQSISVLDPLFYENYLYGGLYLSIIKDDVLGAAEIFTNGLKIYPDDYALNYYAGFNYYFEIGDYKNGLIFLEKIQYHPRAPEFIKLIVQKLKFETHHDFSLAIDFLKNNYNESKDPVLKKRFLKDIYALQAEFDLKCLNEGKKDCNKTDIEGNQYLLKNNKWITLHPFTPYGIKRRK